MHKKFYLLLLALMFIPAVSSAHQTQMYEINGVEYQMVIGSLNEPVIVDDKTGFSLDIIRDGQFFVGAQDSLQVELLSGDKSKVLNLSPVHGAEGAYKAPFIATVPTTLTYRVFGTLENTPVDLSFTCNPAGHPQAEENTTATPISEGVVQTLQRGAFGCPQAKEAFGFPEEAPSAYTVQTAVADLQDAAEDQEENGSSNTLPLIAIVISLLSSALAYKAYTQKK